MARAVPDANVDRQDFSLQNATTLPINDSLAFMALMKVLTASNPIAGLVALPFRDGLRVLRTLSVDPIAVTPENLTLSGNCVIAISSTERSDVVKQSTPFPESGACAET
jgi:hypothetical protein